MCLEIPGRVVDIKGDVAIVDFFGQRKEAQIKFTKPKVGDYVLVKYGMIIEILEGKVAKDVLEVWKKLKL